MTENKFAFPGVLRQLWQGLPFLSQIWNIPARGRAEKWKNGRMKLGSACAPSRSAAGSPSTSADFNLGPGPKLKFSPSNFNFGPGPRLKASPRRGSLFSACSQTRCDTDYSAQFMVSSLRSSQSPPPMQPTSQPSAEIVFRHSAYIFSSIQSKSG